MSKKIASARISEKSSQLLQDLNNSLPFDKVLYAEDIEGSRAHAYMLCEQGIISNEDYEKIEGGLYEILGEIESGVFKLDGDDEDIHMAIEGRLTEKVGDAGKRLHTARSRNDQVALDFRLYVQNNTKAIADLAFREHCYPCKCSRKKCRSDASGYDTLTACTAYKLWLPYDGLCKYV